ncbi:unnamed protein product [Sphagnum jensenii]|uniref:Uncharacterized protein n=1 Tax=Sphagnum jensenii TaxID=128206 RepID=A0ABP0WIW3_9BRYO
MFEDAAAEAECRDAEKMTVTSTIMKGLVKALQEDINKVLPARDADTGRLKESLEEKDINTIWACLLKKAEDHVASLLLKMEEANANLQQPEQKDLLDCEADCEEIWRGEIQSDLVSTYFESYLKSLVDQVNVLIESILWKHTVEGGANDWVGNCQQAIDKSVQKEAEYQKQLQEECESKVVALETAEVLKTQEISELQTRFKCQEAHLQDLLQQEHRKVSEMLTKQEELHALKDALQASLEVQQFRQKMEWEISSQIIEDKTIDMEGKITDLSNMLMSSEESFETHKMKQVIEFEISSQISEDKVVEMEKHISYLSDMLKETRARAESLSTELEATVDSVHKGLSDRVLVAEIDTLHSSLDLESEASLCNLQEAQSNAASLMESSEECSILERTLHQKELECRLLEAECERLQLSLDNLKAVNCNLTRALAITDPDLLALRGSLEDQLGGMELLTRDCEEQVEGRIWRDKVEDEIVELVTMEWVQEWIKERCLPNEEIPHLQQLRSKIMVERERDRVAEVGLMTAHSGVDDDRDTVLGDKTLYEELDGGQKKEVKLAHKMIGDSGLTDKERSAFEDKLLILQAELEGYKAALKRAEAKESKELIDQAVGPASGCVTDPVLVVIRRDTEAAVEGFMVDIGESPSKNFSSRKSKEVVSSLKREVLELRRERDQIMEQNANEIYKLKRESAKEIEKIKVEAKQKQEDKVAKLKEEVLDLKQLLEQASHGRGRTQSRCLATAHADNDNWQREKDLSLGLVSKKEHHIGQLVNEVTDPSEDIIDKKKMENVIAELAMELKGVDYAATAKDKEGNGQETIMYQEVGGVTELAKGRAQALEGRMVSDSWKKVFRELVAELRSFECSLRKLEKIVNIPKREEECVPQRDLHFTELEVELLQASEARAEDESLKLEQHGELAVLELETMLKRLEKVRVEVVKTISQKNLRIGELTEKLTQASAYRASNGSLEKVQDQLESRISELETVAMEHETERKRLEVLVADLQNEQCKLKEQAATMGEEKTSLHEVITNLKGERSWLEERVPGLEKKIATEQSRLEEMAAVHAFERDRMKEIIAAHKNEQNRLEKNLKKAEVEVDLLGDEVDNLVALLERVSTVLEHYSPVLQHYPGVKEVAETIKSELSERTGDPIVQ